MRLRFPSNFVTSVSHLSQFFKHRLKLNASTTATLPYSIFSSFQLTTFYLLCNFLIKFWTNYCEIQSPVFSHKMSAHPYAIDSVPQEVTNLIVTRIRIVAHTMGPVISGGQLSQNHWSLYLVHPDGSVRLNMQTDPTSNSSRGVLAVTNHGYTTVSSSAVKSWEFNVIDNLAVYYVIQLVLDKGRYAYDMAEGGVGCRYWM